MLTACCCLAGLNARHPCVCIGLYRPCCHRPPSPPGHAGIRIMEVRAAYAKEDFEWDNLKRLAIDGLAADNTRLLRQHANHRFTAMLDRAGGDEH